MSEALVIARGGQLGDQIDCLPVICALAEQYDRLWLAMANDDVRRIAKFPPNVKDYLNVHWKPEWTEPSGYETMHVYSLGVAASIGFRYWPEMMHPIQHLFQYVGLPVPDPVPQPQLDVPDRPCASFDYVLAPYTTATERSMTHEQWCDLRNALRPLIGINAGIEHEPLDDLVRLMRNAKCVITVDAGPSRLAYAAGVKNHVILDSTVTPWQWQTHPGATHVPGRVEGTQAMWDVNEIAEVVRGLL
jgi:hypothetical protein